MDRSNQEEGWTQETVGCRMKGRSSAMTEQAEQGEEGGGRGRRRWGRRGWVKTRRESEPKLGPAWPAGPSPQ